MLLKMTLYAWHGMYKVHKVQDSCYSHYCTFTLYMLYKCCPEYIKYSCTEATVQVESFYPSIGSQVLLVAQFKRLFLLFLPIVPSEQTEALPAAQKPANSLQRHSNQVKWVSFLLSRSAKSTYTAYSRPQVTPKSCVRAHGTPSP